jgi:hypothetical protein
VLFCALVLWRAVKCGQEIDIKPEQLLQFETTEPLEVTIAVHNGQQAPRIVPLGPALEVQPAEPQQSRQ